MAGAIQRLIITATQVAAIQRTTIATRIAAIRGIMRVVIIRIRAHADIRIRVDVITRIQVRVTITTNIPAIRTEEIGIILPGVQFSSQTIWQG